MGKFENLVQARSKLCEFNENPAQRQAAPEQPAQPVNPFSDAFSKDPNLVPLVADWRKTGNAAEQIQPMVAQAGPNAPAQADAALDAYYKQAQQQPPPPPAPVPPQQVQQTQQTQQVPPTQRPQQVR